MRNHNFQRNDEDDDDEQVILFQPESGKTDQDRYMEMVEASLSANEINQHTLGIAVDILEKSWWWKFRRTKTKVKMIEQMYEELTKLI